jgi:ArsR family transcriptional regulator
MRMNGLTGSHRPVFDRLQTLGDETRARLLLLLEEHEMTVSELCAVLQLPQSTVSRHLKVLVEDGWLGSRAEGTSRHYRLGVLDGAAAELWVVVRRTAGGSPGAVADAERARGVLARRRERSREFFMKAASDWDRLREEQYGEGSALLPLLGLLDPGWVVADLGAGTGSLSASVAPFVARVMSVDGSAEMLAVLRARTVHLSNVEVRQGELEALPIDSASVDIAFLAFALHYVVEPWIALAEAGRILRPGGRLIVVDMREHDREEYRAERGHVWLGFTQEQIAHWSARAGYESVVVSAVPPDPSAKGPSLFIAVFRVA